jgi:hypothetical protein
MGEGALPRRDILFLPPQASRNALPQEKVNFQGCGPMALRSAAASSSEPYMGSPARASYRLTLDAWKMLSIADPSKALNSTSVWRTDRPSVKAREKLAITPVLWLSLAFASSRE